MLTYILFKIYGSHFLLKKDDLVFWGAQKNLRPRQDTWPMAMLLPRFCVAQALRIMRHSHDQNESFMLSLAETVKSLHKKNII